MVNMKTLTTSELIDLLKTLPQDMPVNISCEGGCVQEGIVGFRGIEMRDKELDGKLSETIVLTTTGD